MTDILFPPRTGRQVRVQNLIPVSHFTLQLHASRGELRGHPDACRAVASRS